MGVRTGRPPLGEQKIGPLIRARRQQLRLTLQQLADGAGISVGYVSQVERDLATPSPTTLAGIARTLDVGIDYFIATPEPGDALSRAAGRPSFSVAGSSIHYERIGTDFAGNVLSSFILIIPPGYRSETVSHEGEEIIYLIQGKLWVTVEAEEVELGPGDGFHFRGNRPHAWRNRSTRPVRLLWTGTVPLFRSRRTQAEDAENVTCDLGDGITVEMPHPSTHPLAPRPMRRRAG